MIHSAAEFVFSHVCHQEAARCWAPHGDALALCQRCTGVYVGAALMAPLLALTRFKPSSYVLYAHGVLILQVIPFGLHLIPHPASVRTLSGQLFITGVLFLAWANIQQRWLPPRSTRTARPYWQGVVIISLALQVLVRAPTPYARPLLEALALLGAATIGLAATFTAAEVCLRARWRQ